jgi:class 3 adenylate cyclase/tetratricopeptide (TPR) repeat protein
MTCATCGAPLRAGRKFCPACGTPVARACPACGTTADPDDRFCADCGGALPGADAPAQSAAAVAARPDAQPAATAARTTIPAAERRLVSVLFADLVGFTGLAEHRDAEEVRELLTRYFDTARVVVGRYGGTVEKFIGDAVMAVWGTPVAREDDAERAVRAAMEMTGAVSNLGSELGGALRLRAGVVTGEVAVTVGAEGQGMVAGDVVVTASRIQSVAEPGTVLVDDATRSVTATPILYEDAGSRELKGREQPVHVWRATQVVAMVGGAQRSAGLEAPFTGRDRELRLVKDLFHATAEERRARLVSVTGIAGIGKSRLAWEFQKYIDGLAELVRWHRGRCLAYGEGVTYWALADMIRSRARILEGEPQTAAAEKLRATVEKYAADAAEATWLESRLAHLLGLEEVGSADRDDLFAAWRRFLERIAEEAPTVLVFEDLHWADPGLLDFVEYLLDWSRDHRLFVMTLARPELIDLRPTWGSQKRNFVSMHLEPLAPQAMDELVGALVPGLPSEVRRRITERSEGVPLYAIETVRMLLDRGVLRRQGDTCVVTGQVEDLDVPDSLHALIAARLDRLDPQLRDLLQHAAVLGQSTTVEALAAVTGAPAAELQPALDTLVAREFLTVQTDRMSPELGQYVFLQALVRRVAYDTLSKRERKVRHLAAARHLTSAFPGDADEVVEVLASHLVAAYSAAPADPDAEELRDRARAMLGRAGQRAASLAAMDEAYHYYAQAAELAVDAGDRAELLERAGDTAGLAGRSDVAVGLLEEAVSILTSEGRTHPAARVSARLGEVLWDRGDSTAALERMEAAYGHLAGEEADADLATLAAMLGRCHALVGSRELAAERIDAAIRIADELALAQVSADALITKGILLVTSGRRAEPEALTKHALAVALENNLTTTALRASFNLSGRLTSRGDYAGAIGELSSALGRARTWGNRLWEWRLLGQMVASLVEIGRWDEAVARDAELPDLDVTAAVPALQGNRVTLVHVHVHRGDLESARRLLHSCAALKTSPDQQDVGAHAAAAAAISAASGAYADAVAQGTVAFDTVDTYGSAEDWVNAGFVLAVDAGLALGDEPTVESLIARASAPRLLVARPFQGKVIRARGALAAHRGDRVGAAAEYSAALRAFRALDAVFDQAVTLLALAGVVAAESPDAPAMLAEARGIFTQLRATPWLARVEEQEAALQVRAGPVSAAR